MLLSILCGAFVNDRTVHAETREYQIDPEHLTIGFLIEHTGYAKVLGQFRVASGSYQFDEETGELSDVSIVVETGSVFTDHEQRDAHVRGEDFLDTRRFPTMTFSAATARPQGNRTYEVAGQLNLLGVTRPLTLTATWNKSGRSPIGLRPYVMGVSARGSFQRSAFGMTYAVENGWVGDAVEIIVEFEARRR
jgi:polyisoprenoid-binding protein YceI